jgi:hypothetical protein
LVSYPNKLQNHSESRLSIPSPGQPKQQSGALKSDGPDSDENWQSGEIAEIAVIAVIAVIPLPDVHLHFQ